MSDSLTFFPVFVPSSARPAQAPPTPASESSKVPEQKSAPSRSQPNMENDDSSFTFKAGLGSPKSTLSEFPPFTFNPVREELVPAPLVPGRKHKKYEFGAGTRPAQTNPNIPFTFAVDEGDGGASEPLGSSVGVDPGSSSSEVSSAAIAGRRTSKRKADEI